MMEAATQSPAAFVVKVCSLEAKIRDYKSWGSPAKYSQAALINPVCISLIFREQTEHTVV